MFGTEWCIADVFHNSAGTVYDAAEVCTNIGGHLACRCADQDNTHLGNIDSGRGCDKEQQAWSFSECGAVED